MADFLSAQMAKYAELITCSAARRDVIARPRALHPNAPGLGRCEYLRPRVPDTIASVWVPPPCPRARRVLEQAQPGTSAP